MKIYILILLMNFGIVLGLEGPLKSICYVQQRYQRIIAIRPNENTTMYDTRSVEKCCEGYKEVNGECQPVCEMCGFGICIAPNVCQCDKYYLEPWCIEARCPAGYKGPNCNEECSRDTFGVNCENACQCRNGDCDRETGRCDCHEGWYGPSCSSCNCSNGGKCDPLTGHCDCPLGYTGKRCEDICPENFWGLNCSETCNCKNSGCNRITGKCENDCTNGKFVNEGCLCDEGWTGETCDDKCECQNGKCNRSGDCICEPGWQGKKCEETCGEGYYGLQCAQKCVTSGPGNFLCDPIQGVTCKPGYNGTECKDLCSEGTFGKGCAPCLCVNASKCNKFTGECECNPGWYGSKCDLSCPESTYGKNCEHECECPKCRPTDGFCQCQTDWNGTHCKEYCPLKYFNITTNQCVEVNYSPSFDFDTDTVIIAGTVISLALLAFCFTIIIIIVRVRVAKKERRNETEQRYMALLNNRTYRPASPIYEEIPETHPNDQYNCLVHIPVEEGYLIPKDLVLPQNEMYSLIDDGYVSLKNLSLQRHSDSEHVRYVPHMNIDSHLRSFKVKSSSS